MAALSTMVGMTNQDKAKSFHERFGIEIGLDEARLNFINRIENSVFDEMPSEAHQYHVIELSELYRMVAYILGIRTGEIPSLRTYVGNDFHRCLRVLEALHVGFKGTRFEEELSQSIKLALNASEVDLGVDWQDSAFVRTGAPLLDEHLVNESLRWLAEPKYKSVRQPFEKGLAHYLEAQNRPDRLADVVTDMYEALEALAKIVTGRPNKDLSANAERFISAVNVSHRYKTLLKNYIIYGNEFRHAEREGKPRPPLSEPEVEAFIYLTGLFIRLAIRTT